MSKRQACRKVGCPTAHTNTNGHCDKHQHLSGWGKNQHLKGNRHKRGYGYQWTKIRERILERDEYLCQQCLSEGISVTANTVDHIKAKTHGGDDSDSNLQSLCRPCHGKKTARERL